MKLFISYASADRARCRQIVELLSLAHEPWFDRRITLGIEWPKEIASRITESDAVVWLISAESLASPNCQEEIELARTLRKPILPLLLESNAPVPEFLRRYEHVDLSESLGNFHLVLSGLSVLERQTLRGDRMETGGSTHRVLRRETAVILHSGSSSANMIRILTPSLGSSGWNVVPFDLSRGPTLIAQLPDRTSIIVVILDVHVSDLMARLAELAPPAEIPAVPLYVGPFTLPPTAPPALRELVSQPGIELPIDVAGIDQLTIRRLVTLMNDRIMAHARRALKTNSGSAPRQRSHTLILGPECSALAKEIATRVTARLLEAGFSRSDIPNGYFEKCALFRRQFGWDPIRYFSASGLAVPQPPLLKPIDEYLALPFTFVISTIADPQLRALAADCGYHTHSLDSASALASGRSYLEYADVGSPDLFSSSGESTVLSASPVFAAAISADLLIYCGFGVTPDDLVAFRESLPLELDRRGSREVAVVDVRAGDGWSNDGWSSIEKEGVDLLLPPRASCLEELAALCLSDSSSRGQSVPAPEGEVATLVRPYKFLDYYSEHDSSIFFGRESETMRLVGRVLSGKLVLLYGQSGSGKTSIVNAGLIPVMRQQGYRCAAVRLNLDPIAAVRASILAACGLAPSESESILGVAEARTLATDGTRLLVVIDQFEELFIHHSSSVIRTFAARLAELFGNPYLSIKFVLCVREDYLPDLAPIGEVIPDLFHNYIRLEGLSGQAALQAVVAPARELGVVYEEGLAAQIVHDLGGDSVEPPQLQIVCDRLFDSRTDGVIRFETYEQNGLAKGILTHYLTEVLMRLTEAERAVAIPALKVLVTTQGTKDATTPDELARRVRVEPSTLRGVLSLLVRDRLVRVQNSLERGDVVELSHDYLAAEIRTWLDGEEIAVKAAMQLLGQEIEAGRLHGTLATRERFEIVNQQLARIRDVLTPDELEFGLRCALHHDLAYLDWLDVCGPSEFAAEVLAQALKATESRAQCLRACLGVGVLRLELLRSDALETLAAVGNPHLFEPLETLRLRGAQGDAEFVAEALGAIETRKLRAMSYVPEGPFVMGTEKNVLQELSVEYGIEWTRLEGEMPYREVQGHGFWMDVFPVTNRDYQEYDPNHKYAVGEESHPAVNISFVAAQGYAMWWGKALPTEEEWERAARGRDGRTYPWGDLWDSDRCNTEESSISGTTPVDQYPGGVSPAGCWDMSGNVWEWVDSWFDERLSQKVCKGGGWAGARLWARCAARHRSFIRSQQHIVGFRCVAREGSEA